MEIHDPDRHTYRDVLDDKELELLRQAAWRTLRDALNSTPSAGERVRLLVGVVGQVVDSTDCPLTLSFLVTSLKDGMLRDAYDESLKRGSARD